MRSRMFLHGAVLLLMLLAAVAHAQQTTITHPADAAALNAVFAKLGQKADLTWNISGNLCTGTAADKTDIDNNEVYRTAIKCEVCTTGTGNTSVCRITRLKIYDMDTVGPIPEELWNLTELINLNLARNYLTGPLPSFIGQLTNMLRMTFGSNALSGPVPPELGNLSKLQSLSINGNNFSGSLPSELGNLANLEQLYIDSAGLSGQLPSSLSKLTEMKTLWASDNDFTGQIPDYIGSWSKLREL